MKTLPRIDFPIDNPFRRVIEDAQAERERRQAQRDVRHLIERTAWEARAELLRKRDAGVGPDRPRERI